LYAHQLDVKHVNNEAISTTDRTGSQRSALYADHDWSETTAPFFWHNNQSLHSKPNSNKEIQRTAMTHMGPSKKKIVSHPGLEVKARQNTPRSLSSDNRFY
jgi:hypothetical protein